MATEWDEAQVLHLWAGAEDLLPATQGEPLLSQPTANHVTSWIEIQSVAAWTMNFSNTIGSLGP